MKITAIEVHPVRIPLKPERRMITALGQHTVSEYVLLRLFTDAGIEGIGEATVMPRWSGETVWGAQALIGRVFAPQLIGCDPHDVVEIDREIMRAGAHVLFRIVDIFHAVAFRRCRLQLHEPDRALLGDRARIES